MADNQQIIVEHIVNIDTTAENIVSINAIAGLAVQVSALAGMLPDVAATVTLRAELLAVSRNLGKIGRVSDALPLLETLPPLIDNITAVIGARAEIAAVVAQLHAITSVADGLDTILQAPEYAETAKQAAESATSAIAETATNANHARTAQLNAEMAEAAAKASAAGIEVSAEAAAKSAADAKQAADAAAAVSGLPDASASLPGDPLIWTGTKFGMGGLDESLTSISGVMGISDGTLASIAEAKALAEGVDAKATQAAADALEAKTLAEGVDAKATQAATDAAAAKTVAESASSTVGGFATRLEAAETETGRVSVGLGQHTTSGNIHTPLENVVEIITEAVNGAIAQIRDSGTGTLPGNVDTLKKLADLLNDVDASLTEFLSGTNPDQRGGMIAAINNAQQGVTTLLANALTRMEVVDNLYSEEVTLPLSAAQGSALRGQVEAVAITADLASKPWIQTVETVPTEWPYGFRSDGLLLVRPTSDGVAGADVKAPEWYIFDRTKPAKLVLTAAQVRMADGTTVQSAVGGAVAASTAAQIAATEAKALAEGVDAKATQAQADAAEAKTLASGVDGKATQALEKADEALAKTPAIATQTTPGIVKGSDTVEIGEDGSVNVVGGAGALVISSPTITIPPEVAIGFEFDIQLTAGPVLLPGATVANFEMVMDGGAPVTIPSVDGSATVKHTPTGEPETTLTISAVAVDSLGNRSEIKEATTKQLSAYVEQPLLITPTRELLTGNLVYFTTSPFEAQGIVDSHASSRYRIRDADEAILYDSGLVTDLLTHVANVDGLTVGSSYHADVLHRGKLIGESEWSDVKLFTVRDVKHGDYIPELKCMVLGDTSNNNLPFNDGDGKGSFWIFVANAERRRPFEYPPVFPRIQISPFNNATINQLVFNTAADGLTGSYVNDPYSSEENYNYALSVLSGTPKEYYSSIPQTIGGTTFFIPNNQDLVRIMGSRYFLDSIDPTAESHPDVQLKNVRPTKLWPTSTYGHSYGVWKAIAVLLDTAHRVCLGHTEPYGATRVNSFSYILSHRFFTEAI